MPRSKKNGAVKDKLTENDRLSVIVGREKHQRCVAEVNVAQAQILILQQTLVQAERNLKEAIEEHAATFKRVQKTYGTDDATKYNLETGVITRAKDDAKAAAPN